MKARFYSFEYRVHSTTKRGKEMTTIAATVTANSEIALAYQQANKIAQELLAKGHTKVRLVKEPTGIQQ